MTPVDAMDLVAHVAFFARALRERGVRVSLSDEADAVAALTLVDLSDRVEVRLALRTALKIRPRDAATFDELFELLWVSAAARRRSATSAASRGGLPVKNFGGLPAGKVRETERESHAGADQAPGYSPEAMLRRKPFDECTERDLAEMERLISRLALALATRRSRRLVPTRGRGRVDPRRSFRNTVATDGELLRLARRERAVEEPRLVVLCDTSGSMDRHLRFLLTFLLSLKKAARRTELFAFNTSLVRLTPWVSPAKIAATLERLAAGVPGWSGGTQIGRSLGEFSGPVPRRDGRREDRRRDRERRARPRATRRSSSRRCAPSGPAPGGSSGSTRCWAMRGTSRRRGGWRPPCRTSTSSPPRTTWSPSKGSFRGFRPLERNRATSVICRRKERS